MPLWPFGSRKPDTAEEKPADNPGIPEQGTPAPLLEDPDVDSVSDRPVGQSDCPVKLAFCRSDLARLAFEYLADEGYRPCYDDAGDVVFKCEGLVYIVEFFESDLAFARIVLPGIQDIDDDNRARCHSAAIAAAHDTKAVKPILGSKVSLAIEMFFSTPQHVCEVLPRCCSALRSAMHEFDRQMLQGG